MLHQELREAFIDQAEKPGDLLPLVKAFYRHADPQVLATYQQKSQELAAQLPGPELRSGRGFAVQSLANNWPGTLGEAWYQFVKTNGLDPDPTGNPLLDLYEKDSDEYYLTYRYLKTRSLWQVVLGYHADYYGNLALASFSAAQRFDPPSLLQLPVVLARIGFVVPEVTFVVMDALTDGWQRGKAAKNLLTVAWEEWLDKPLNQVRTALNVTAPAPRDEKTLTEAASLLELDRPIPADLKKLFWEEVEVVPGSNNVIEQIANFVRGFDDNLRQSYASAMSGHKGVLEAFEDGYLRGAFSIQDLRDYPAGTLGYAYYHQIVDNGLEPEILKSDQLVPFRGAVPDYTGQRILQTHDLWHCLTSYTTDGLDEIALQAFQLAQLGSAFSSNLLTMLMTRSVLLNPQMISYFMQAISYGWQHGRRTPPLIPVHWEQHWGDTIEQLRQQYQIEPHTADLMAV
jgi:ubiquinone biosynthesis protein Coq4